MVPHNDQAMSQSLDRVGQINNNTKPITNPLALSFLIGLNNKKCISVSDFVRSPRSSLNCCCGAAAKVGLSIINSLGDDRSLVPDVVFGPALRIKSSGIRDKLLKLFPVAKSMKIEKERSGVVFEIGDNSSEAEPNCTRVLSRSKLSAEGVFPGSGFDNAFSSCLSEDEMEDYTCIIAHGPIPKTTHIYGDRVLECHKYDDYEGKRMGTHLDFMLPSVNFLSICNFCNKTLQVGKDIYMYREKSFCSDECRSEEMMIDEEDMEDPCMNL